jgi:predicted secreted protein
MSLTTAVAIYFIIWWVVLFTILPFGIRSQHETGQFPEGTDPGAPTVARLGLRLLWTTVVASVVFAVFAVVYVNRWITFDDLAALFGLP